MNADETLELEPSLWSISVNAGRYTRTYNRVYEV